MPRTISNDVASEKNKLGNVNPWVRLLEVPVSASEAIRVTDHDEAVSWNGETWSPYPIQVGAIDEDSEGGLSTVTVKVSNVGRLVMPYLESGQLVGGTATIHVVNVNALAASDAVESITYEVMAAQATDLAASFTLGIANLLGAEFPSERMSRTRCRFLKEYGSGRCGYDTTLPNLISGTRPTFDPAGCDGTLEGGNGCRAHGENETANGQEAIHPGNHGAFPGILRGDVIL